MPNEFYPLDDNGVVHPGPKPRSGCSFKHRIADTMLSLLAVVAVIVSIVIVLRMEQRQQQFEKEQKNLTQQIKAMEEHIKSLQNLLSNRHETLRQLKHPTDNQTKKVTDDEQNELLEEIRRKSVANSPTGNISTEGPTDKLSHPNCNCTTALPQSKNATNSPQHRVTTEPDKIASTVSTKFPTPSIVEYEARFEAVDCHEKVVKQEWMCGEEFHEEGGVHRVITGARVDEKKKLLINCCDVRIKVTPAL